MSTVRQKQPVVKRRRKLTRAERDYEREAQERFKVDVLRLDTGRCIGATSFASDHECTGPLQAHHAVKQQWLRAYVPTLNWTNNEVTDFLWDPANGLTLCRELHDRHHDGTGFKINLEMLPARVVDFADAYRLRPFLEREHPPFHSVSDGEGTDG